jgi:hypothetical protein
MKRAAEHVMRLVDTMVATNDRASLTASGFSA